MISLSHLKRQGYNQQRAASLGAAITLVSGYGQYTALFECATHLAGILGNWGLTDLGDGILDSIPCYKIPVEDMVESLGKIRQRFSIALVEYTCQHGGHRFIAVWRIDAQRQIATNTDGVPVLAITPQSTNADDY